MQDVPNSTQLLISGLIQHLHQLRVSQCLWSAAQASAVLHERGGGGDRAVAGGPDGGAGPFLAAAPSMHGLQRSLHRMHS